MNTLIKPNWPAPQNITAFTTVRSIEVAKYPERNNLKTVLDLPSEPIWLNQTHSNIVIPALSENRDKIADASFTNQANQVCAVTTADCLPILLCQAQGSHVAAIHAGWRGLVSGIIVATLKQLNLPPQEMLAWIGPCISQTHYEVGDEVRDAFLKVDADTGAAFIPSPNQRWLADLHAIACLQLRKQGVTQIFGGDYCTYSDEKTFFSYRRDKEYNGRMASLIWLKD